MVLVGRSKLTDLCVRCCNHQANIGQGSFSSTDSKGQGASGLVVDLRMSRVSVTVIWRYYSGVVIKATAMALLRFAQQPANRAQGYCVKQAPNPN